MKKVAVIGAGISGISCAKLLREKGYEPVIYEKNGQAGGLVRCTLEKDNILFHRVGGHVFNSKKKDILDWFWNHFDKENEFLTAKRNASIYIDGSFLNYPIENSIYLLAPDEIESIISELLAINAQESSFANDSNQISDRYSSFKDFLLKSFGPSLCSKYFFPYNEKIWNRELDEIPITWLQGKLPMPDLKSVLLSNIVKNDESSMVHSTFYYPIEGGSQFIVNRLLKGLDIIYNANISQISKSGNGFIVDGIIYDNIIYTGDLRSLPSIFNFQALDIPDVLRQNIANLSSNPTSNALCECEPNPYSWVYFPSKNVRCHRAIMTGNFASSNNGALSNRAKISCTVEFSKDLPTNAMISDIKKLPFDMEPIAFNYEKSSYIVHDHSTSKTVADIKTIVQDHGIYLCGRFAEWEYYNMDAAIDAAMVLIDAYF